MDILFHETHTKLVRVLMAQARQPFTYRNGREGPSHGGHKGPVEEVGLVELRQELAESHNTIYQLCKPFKRQRRDGWQRNGRRQDQLAT